MDNRLIDRYQARIGLLEGLAQSLERETRRALGGVEHIDRITFRVKPAAGFGRKAADPRTTPPYTDPLVEIEDQVGGRVLVYFLDDLEAVAGRLTRVFNTVERIHHRPARDAEFGYESDHHICIIPPHLKPRGWDRRDDLPTTFELQVRTLLMHAYAEPHSQLAYAGPSELDPEIRRELAWIAASAWGADQAYSRVLNQYDNRNHLN
jgi:ppGpp synthetase/RelA/SpoT-type nucleotidyltranferase